MLLQPLIVVPMLPKGSGAGSIGPEVNLAQGPGEARGSKGTFRGAGAFRPSDFACAIAHCSLLPNISHTATGAAKRLDAKVVLADIEAAGGFEWG